MIFRIGPKFGVNNITTAFSEGSSAIDGLFTAGSELVARFAGTLTIVSNNNNGYYIKLANSETGQSVNYADVHDVPFSTGDSVAEGDIIGIKPHKYNILNIALHLSAAGGASENFSIQVNHGYSSNFNFTLLKQDMNAITDVIYQPSSIDSALLFTGADTLKFTYPNSNNRNWGLMVTYGYMGQE